MATNRIEIHHTLLPDTTGTVYWASGNAGGAFDRYPHEMLLYSDFTTNASASGAFLVPQDYSSGGTTKVIVRWASTTTDTSSVVWDLAYKCVADGESLDPTTDDDSSDSVTSQLGGTVRLAKDASMTITAGDFAVADTVLWKLTRDAQNASDDLATTAYVEAVFFEYTTTA